ncbi:MAG: xanthine dehydrogenase family protein molybdopterin-binding subunit [Caldilineaceae bacterium]|nr:xanthine dehydrogenase family protein molybdopterin-binding subunit [Caldilineaceae bacterium]MDE0339103.1 xanthine dehydrogenase family protein molybdopterin-binding subunit [Caldilineaceae bacterium]
MSTRQFGRPIKRNEDPRLLTGRALFTDDVQLAGMLHVAFLRSDLAHARIRSVDAEGACRRPGVVAVYTAADLGEFWQPGPLLVPPPPVEKLEFHERTQVPLAKDKVRHAGEAVAMIVAESRYIAEDALDHIFVEYEPLDAVTGLEAALSEDAPLVHEDLGHNVSARVTQTKGDWTQAESEADLVVRRRFHYDRGTAAALENRGIVASWDEKSQRLTIWDTTQAPIAIRNGLAAMLGLSEHQVRVIAPFIGGGFGPKIMMFYPEEVLLPWAALQLGRPLKWIEDREENFYATTQERGQVHDAAIALKSDGTILGVKDQFLHDAGAYAPYGLTLPISSQCTLLGPYVVPSYHSEFSSVFTNKPIVTPYRGAGRQHGVFVMERLLDIAAKELDIDLVEIRRRNFIPPDRFPYSNEIIFQDFTPLVYDSGNYEPALERALELIGYRDFIGTEQPRREAAGERVGIAVVNYIEGTGIGPYEGARVTVEASGKVTVATGVGTQGQGHYTSFAQVVAEQIGVEVSDVHVVTGDTDLFYWGAGTFASRGAVVAGNAMHAAAAKVRAKILKLAGEKLEAAAEDLELLEGRVQVKGVPQTSISLGQLAAEANPMRGAVQPGTEPGLEATEYFGPERGATASGVHAMILKVDPETFLLEIEKYVVVHDCGTVINPLILDGQIQGGVAQGIGNAFYEQLHFDDNGALLNASLMDYLLPTASDVPNILSDHFVTPSPLNPLGVKGAGEAGAIPVGALFAQALDNAYRDIGLEVREIPLSPNRLFELVSEIPARETA